MSYKLIISLLTAGTLTALTACTSTGSSADEPVDGVAVKFTARTDDSRAAVTNSNTIKNTSFAVYGDMVPTSSAATATPTVIFNGTEVTHSTTDNTWQYANPQYWFPSHTHSFVAVHPAKAVAGAQYSDNTLSFSYTLPADYHATTDLLAAAHRRNYTYKTTEPASPVAFNFTHILSRLNFIAEIKNSIGRPIHIDRFSLHNVYTSATYTIKPAPITGSNTQTDDYAGEWIDHEDLPSDGNKLFERHPSDDIEPGEYLEFFPIGTNPLFVIPQNTHADLKVVVEYTLRASEELNLEEKHETVEAYIYSAVVSQWLPGKSYTYRFTIGTNSDILFNVPTVDDWAESIGGNYIITD